MPAKKTKKETEVEPQNVKLEIRDAEPKKVSHPQPQAPIAQASEEKKGWFPKIDAALAKYSPFVKQSWKGLFIDGIRINALQMIIMVALLAISIGIVLGGGVSNTSNIASFIQNLEAALLIILPLAIIAIAVSTAVSFVQYPAVDERAKGGKVEIFKKLKEIAFPAIGYSLIIFIIMILLFIPILLGAIMQNPWAMAISVILSVLAVLIFILVTQFGQWELTIEKTGIFESIGQSYGLVKENVVEVIVFDIMILIFIVLLFIPYFIANMIVQLISTNSGAFSIPIAIAGRVTTDIMWGATLLVLVLPLQYSFWKTLKEKK